MSPLPNNIHNKGGVAGGSVRGSDKVPLMAECT